MAIALSPSSHSDSNGSGSLDSRKADADGSSPNGGNSDTTEGIASGELPATDAPREARVRESHIAELRGSVPAAPIGSLDDLAHQVAALGTESSVAHVLRLGEIVYQGLYGAGRVTAGASSAPGALLPNGLAPGSLTNGALQQAQNEARLASDASAASLRRLAAHPAVAWKVTSLWRAVSVYELSLRLPQLFDLPGLGVSHFRAVLGLPSHVQGALLQSAATEKWTKRRLEAEALRYRTERPRRGRRPLSALEKWTRDAGQLVDQLLELKSVPLDGDTNDIRDVRARLAQIRSLCDQLESRLPA